MAHLNGRISRRRMLQLLGMGAGAAALAACSPSQPAAPTAKPAATQATSGEAQPTRVPEATPTPGGNVPVGEVAASYEEGQAGYGWYQEAHPSQNVELLLWGPSGDETDPWIRAMKAALERFGQKYPEIKTTWEPVPGEDLDTKVNAAMAAKQGPDVIYESDREGEYPRRGVIREIPEEVLPAEYIKAHKFYPVRPLDDGKIYWVHCSAMGPILFANKELLAQEGLTVADIPTTWEEFGRFCEQLTKIEGGQMTQAGFAFNGYARYIWDDMIYQQEAHVQTAEESFVNSPESVNAWQTLIDMYDRFKVNDRAFLNFDEAFGAGKAAITQVWTWFGSSLEANYPDIDWAPALYPTFDGDGPYGRFDYDGPAWMVTTLAEGDKMYAAWELFKYHCHEYQFLVERSHTTGLILATEPHPDYDAMFAEVAAVDNPSQEQRRAQALAVLAKQFAGGMVFPGEVAAPFDNMWQKMEEAILLNQEPINQVVEEYKGLYDEMLSQTYFWVTPEA